MPSLDPSKVSQLRSRAMRDIDEGNIPSCQYALALNGEVLVSETLGAAPADARYAIWSATKPVFASVVWQLIGEGLLSPEMHVCDVWPEFAANGKDVVTLDHLLLFTAGLDQAKLTAEDILDRGTGVATMEQWSLDWTPGTAWAYHPISAHQVMAEMVMRVTGKDHRAVLRERVLDPLGLHRLELGVPLERLDDVQLMVKTGTPPTPEEVRIALGLDELPAALVEMFASAVNGTAASGTVDLTDFESPELRAAGVPGAGAVSDASSLALFYQSLLHNSAGVWTPEVLHDVTRVVRNTFKGELLGVLAMRTRGLETQGVDETAFRRSGSGMVSPETFGHGGASGQIAWADPVTGLSFAYLTNGNDQTLMREGKRVADLAAHAIACIN